MDNNLQTAGTPANASFEGPISLITKAWGLFRARAKDLILIFFIPSLLTIVGNALYQNKVTAIVVVASIIWLVGFILTLLTQVVSIRAISAMDKDVSYNVSLKSLYKDAFKLFPSLLLVIIIQVLAGFGSLILLVIPLIIMAVYSAVYMYTFVLDQKKGFSAFTESYSLVKGRWFKVLGRIIVIGIAAIAVQLILSGIGFLIAKILTVSENAVMIPLGLVSSIIIGPNIACYLYFMYKSLKETRQSVVQTSAFKGWMIAFTVVGVIGVIAGLIIFGLSGMLPA